MLNIYIISPEKGGNNDESNTFMSLRSAKAANQSRRHGRDLVGLAPPNKAPSPPNWNLKPYKSVEFLSIFNVKPPCANVKPPAQAQSPSIDDFLATVLLPTIATYQQWTHYSIASCSERA